ncbi:MAG: hypothetical protein M1396_04140 [Chloroflexi bacterium]|nr:hypothetical protein [Chloroflexota bacterium]
MAEVTAQQRLDVVEDTAYYLDFLDWRVSTFEGGVATWDNLSSEEKNDVLSEWSIVEDRTQTLQRLVARSRVSRADQRRYHELQDRPTRARTNMAGLW